MLPSSPLLIFSGPFFFFCFLLLFHSFEVLPERNERCTEQFKVRYAVTPSLPYRVPFPYPSLFPCQAHNLPTTSLPTPPTTPLAR